MYVCMISIFVITKSNKEIINKWTQYKNLQTLIKIK